MKSNNFLGVGIRLDKNMFFDRTAVKDAIAKSNKRFLARAGMLVRQTARRSMRFRKKSSDPGTPPSAHKKDPKHKHGPLLKDRLFYQFDPFRESVVIGPEMLPGSKTNAPSVQEFGGFARIKRITHAGRAAPRRKGPKKFLTEAQKAAIKQKIQDGTIAKRPVLVKYDYVLTAARPYMRPAMQRELPKFPSLYARYFGPDGNYGFGQTG